MADIDKDQLHELESKIALMKDQYNEVIYAEESSAEKDYQQALKIFEEFQRKFAEKELNKTTAKKRWDEARKKSKTFLKQINNLRNEINKTRKKLELPELDHEEGEKGFIIFQKDHFDDEE